MKLKEILKRSKLIIQIYEGVMNFIYRKSRNIKKRFAKTRFSYGESNPDKVFHIITTSKAKNCGMFSLILVNVLPNLRFDEKKRYVPIVDYQNSIFLPIIQDEENYGKTNPWEDYFEQPGGAYTLDEVYRSAKVETCDPEKYGYKVILWNNKMPMSVKELRYWSRIANKYIRPVKDIMERIEEERSRLFSGNQKVMGISIRAGYRRAAMLKKDIIKGHPKVGSCEYYMEIIQKKMEEWGYEKLFLACDDREYVTKIENYFGEKCCHLDRRYPHVFINDIPVAPDNLEELFREYKGCTVREKTKEYIVETYLLASCDSLYSTINGSSQFAYIVNGGKYRNIEFYNEGLY